MSRASTAPIYVKGKEVVPTREVQLLGVYIDTELRYKKQVANVATKGLIAALALKRLKKLSPKVAH